MAETSFAALWNRQGDFTVADEQPLRCGYAQQFAAWADELCLKALSGASLVSINQAKVLLVDKYFEWYRVVPKRHRTLVSGAHTCIFGVFESAYGRLKVVELAMTPPLLFIPPPPAPLPLPPPPPPAPQIAGIFIGEVEEG